MKRGTLASVFVVLGVTSGASALDFTGSDRLTQMTNSVLASCPAAAGLTYVSGNSATGQSALVNGSQRIAPMARFLDANVCSLPALGKVQGTAVALDAVVVAGSSSSASTCGGLRSTGSITVESETYSFANWRDVLRVIFAGVTHEGAADCGSALRRALVDNWSQLFQATCTTGSCTSLQHLFRPSDGSDSAERFLALLGLSDLVANPRVFCNGADTEDADPVRRACLAGEQVCSKVGDLGLVLPIASTESLTAAQAFPLSPCTTQMKFAPAPMDASGVIERCPNGDIPVNGGQCLVPVDASGSAACLATKKTKPLFVFDNTPIDGIAPSNVDGRVYNRHLRKPDGTYQARSATDTRQLKNAFHRLHASTPALGGGVACTERDGTRQIGCLTQASPCSLGFGGVQAQTLPGVAGLALNDATPTVTNVRNLLAHGTPMYPFSYLLYLSETMSENELSSASPLESALVSCFSQTATVESAATAAGLVPLGTTPFCQDFNEQAICGAPRNDNACGVSFNVCPVIDSIDVSPLETRIGGTITLSGHVRDVDSAPAPLVITWSSALGTFTDAHAAATTFTCVTAGSGTIVMEAFDGDCPVTENVNVTCSP